MKILNITKNKTKVTFTTEEQFTIGKSYKVSYDEDIGKLKYDGKRVKSFSEIIQTHVCSFGDWHTIDLPTCIATGIEERYCDCGEVESRAIEIDPDSHEWEGTDGGEAPTCTTAGHGKIKCKLCGKIEIGDPIPALGHDDGEWHTISEPICATNGMRELRCTRCNAVIKTEAILASGHDWGNWVVTTTATCIAKGVETRTCKSNASHKETRDIAINPNAHNWGSWIQTTAPTCTTAGTDTRTCTLNSSHKETRVGANALGHDSGAWHITKEATYTATGIKELRCTRCGKVLETATIPVKVISTADELNDFLASLPANTKGNPHLVKANLSNIGGNDSSISLSNALKNNSTKYVNLDLSGNTFTIIGNSAFKDCSSLVSVTIPNSVTSIESSAFNGCDSLTSIIIPNGVTVIRASAFSKGTSLNTVTFEGIIASGRFSSDAFLSDLKIKFYADNATNGTPGTYTKAPGNGPWTKQ